NMIVGRLDEARVDVVDAIIPTDVGIDTADYKVGTSSVAFGIRVRHQNYSAAAPLYEEFMNLYVLDGQKLRKIVSGMRSYRHHNEGNDRCYSEDVAKALVSIGKSKSHGYFDLIVKNSTRSITRDWNQVSCIDTKKKTDLKHFVLKYDGRIYSIPEP